MKDELDTLPNERLDELFAIEVAGWRFHMADPKESWVVMHEDWWISKDEIDRRGPTTMFKRPHNFCSDANAVLPWLEKAYTWSKGTVGSAVTVYSLEKHPVIADETIMLPRGHHWNETQPAVHFARAAVIALIRSRRPKR